MTLQTGSSVADIMTANPITIRDVAPLREAQRRLRSGHITGLPVVDASDRVVGVLSQSDLLELCRLDDDGPLGRHDSRRVGDAMVWPAITIGQWAPVEAAARLLLDYQVHRLIVVDEDHRAVGVLSATDFVRLVAEQRS